MIADRVLYSAVHYPANYGFIPQSYCDDGDPLDVLVLCQEPLTPLCLVECKPVGMITMRDEKGQDDKIIAAWNGLALRVFAEAAAVLDNRDYRDVAFDMARFVTSQLIDTNGRTPAEVVEQIVEEVRAAVG